MDNLMHAREWERLASMDLKTAEYLTKMRPVPVEIVCYLCQQSAEKYLKGYLVFHGINPPRIHDLDELCRLCAELSHSFGNITDPCTDLTTYGVRPRYPSKISLEEQDMMHALAGAKVVRDLVAGLIPAMFEDPNMFNHNRSREDECRDS